MLKPNIRLFRWIDISTDDNEKFILDVVKILRFKNSTTVKIRHIKEYNNGLEEVISTEELSDEYTELLADGYISFSIVSLGSTNPMLAAKNKDVMVTFVRTSDITSKTPYAVCRQKITDLFAANIYPNITYYGLSISKDSCPAELTFDNFFSCQEILKSETYAFYLDDTLDDILECVRTAKTFYKELNNILYGFFVETVLKMAGDNKVIAKYHLENKTCCLGACTTVDALLTLNNFINDIYFGLGVYPLDIDLSNSVNTCLDEESTVIISNIVKQNITKSIVVKYDKDIELDAIERNHILILDKNKNLYIIGYVYEGTYHIPVEDIEDEYNIEALNELAEMDSVKYAYSKIHMNTQKYNQ